MADDLEDSQQSFLYFGRILEQRLQPKSRITGQIMSDKGVAGIEGAFNEIGQFARWMNKESPRGVALVCAAYIDDLLFRALTAVLLDNSGTKTLFQGVNPPLGSFASRSHAAFSLGIFDQVMYDDCSVIRKIRNKFGHTVEIDFDSEEVTRLCGRLQFPKSFPDPMPARSQFTVAAFSIIGPLVSMLRRVPDKIDLSAWRPPRTR